MSKTSQGYWCVLFFNLLITYHSVVSSWHELFFNFIVLWNANAIGLFCRGFDESSPGGLYFLLPQLMAVLEGKGH